VIGVDGEVASINVVALEHHLEDFWLMNCAFLHETDYFVLLRDCLLDVMVQLHLDFVLDLTGLREEVLVFGRIREVLTIFCQKMELADMSPRVVPVSHGVHGPNSNILASSQQVHPMDFSIEILPIERKGDPSEAVCRPEHRESELPIPHERIDEE